jgi:hypothetical protein
MFNNVNECKWMLMNVNEFKWMLINVQMIVNVRSCGLNVREASKKRCDGPG